MDEMKGIEVCGMLRGGADVGDCNGVGGRDVGGCVG